MTVDPKVELYVNRLLEEWKQHGRVIISVDYDDTLSPWKLGNKEDQTTNAKKCNYLLLLSKKVQNKLKIELLLGELYT